MFLNTHQLYVLDDVPETLMSRLGGVGGQQSVRVDMFFAKEPTI